MIAPSLRSMSSLRFVSLLALVVLVSACGPAPTPTGTASSTQPPVSPSATAGGARYRATPLSPPVKVSMGVVASTSDGGIFVAYDRGYFKDEGIDLDIQRFQSLVDMVAPLTGGQLLIASGAVAASLFNAAARGLAIRIVADKGQTLSPEWDFQPLVIRKDLIESGKVKDYKDLKGLTLVTSGRGNSPESTLAAALRRGGLTLQDVNYTQMGFPEMVAALGSKGIDGGIVIEPFASRVESEGTGVRWKTSLEILGRSAQVAVIVYGEQIAANQDLARRWMTAYIRGVRDYNDAFGPKKKDRDQVVRVLTERTSVTDPKVYELMRPAGLDPDSRLDTRSIQEDLNYYVDSGQVKDKPDLSTLIDSSFQQYAVQLLGPYQP